MKSSESNEISLGPRALVFCVASMVGGSFSGGMMTRDLIGKEMEEYDELQLAAGGHADAVRVLNTYAEMRRDYPDTHVQDLILLQDLTERYGDEALHVLADLSPILHGDNGELITSALFQFGASYPDLSPAQAEQLLELSQTVEFVDLLRVMKQSEWDFETVHRDAKTLRDFELAGGTIKALRRVTAFDDASKGRLYPMLHTVDAWNETCLRAYGENNAALEFLTTIPKDDLLVLNQSVQEMGTDVARSYAELSDEQREALSSADIEVLKNDLKKWTPEQFAIFVEASNQGGLEVVAIGNMIDDLSTYLIEKEWVEQGMYLKRSRDAVAQKLAEEHEVIISVQGHKPLRIMRLSDQLFVYSSRDRGQSWEYFATL